MSTNFKMAVVAEVITGQISQTAAQKKYGIGGHCTVERWIRRYGGNKELNKINKARMPNDKARIKELKQRIHQLEALLADLQLEKRALDKIIDLAEEEYKISIKKILVQGDPETQRRRRKNKYTEAMLAVWLFQAVIL